METASIICASLTSVGILSTIFTDQLWINIVSTALSFITVFITAYFKSFDPNKLTKAHKEAANKLLIVRNELTGLPKVVPAEAEYPSGHGRAGAGQEKGDADEKLKAKYGCVKHDKVFLSLALSPRNDSLRGQTHCLY